MIKSIVSTPDAPAAVGPYSQAVKAGGFVFASGQIPLDPGTGALVGGDIRKEAHQALSNLRAVLEAAGSSMNHVVKATVFLTDMADFSDVNEVYAGFFDDAPPARACIAVAALPKGARVEVEAVALARE
ncbi:MAG: RidA family protein [Desulfobacterales bacterium]